MQNYKLIVYIYNNKTMRAFLHFKVANLIQSKTSEKFIFSYKITSNIKTYEIWYYFFFFIAFTVLEESNDIFLKLFNVLLTYENYVLLIWCLGKEDSKFHKSYAKQPLFKEEI